MRDLVSDRAATVLRPVALELKNAKLAELISARRKINGEERKRSYWKQGVCRFPVSRGYHMAGARSTTSTLLLGQTVGH